MNSFFLERLRCPACSSNLEWRAIKDSPNGDIHTGVVWCASCMDWFPIEDELLELLPVALGYLDDRERFWVQHEVLLKSLRLKPTHRESDRKRGTDQQRQQTHFDQYVKDEKQTYTEYEGMPFWRAVDHFVFREWRQLVKEKSVFLDFGCGQGRSTFKFVDLPIQIVGFDISKGMIADAIHRYRDTKPRAKACFFVADASKMPFKDGVFDYVLGYGVLHHVPSPETTCKEVIRVLKPGGMYFGSENNESIFRGLFDALQKLVPAWHEEAGSEPLISIEKVRQWASSDCTLDLKTHVFVPPHLANLSGQRLGRSLIHFTDWLGQSIPGLRNNGGLVTYRMQKTRDRA